jgi:hypothetical protein
MLDIAEWREAYGLARRLARRAARTTLEQRNDAATA